MVDALHSVLRVLRSGGILVDVRPTMGRVPRLERDGRVTARLMPADQTRHLAAEESIARCVVEGQLRPLRSGHFWFRHTFPDRDALLRWIGDRDDWTIDRRSVPAGTRTLRRAIEFTHYRRR